MEGKKKMLKQREGKSERHSKTAPDAVQRGLCSQCPMLSLKPQEPKGLDTGLEH